jgi:hypothetical protein
MNDPAGRNARRRRRLLLAMLACLVLAVAAAGMVMVVHAEFRAPPALKPYDPLQRW